MNPGGSTLFGDQTEVALNADAAYEIIGGPAALVPEPSTWILLAMSAMGMTLLARRRAMALVAGR